MWWRSPWLTVRRRLLGLALFDAFCLIGVYALTYGIRIGAAPKILSGSALSLSGLWLTISYLLGRYSRSGLDERESLRRRLLATLLVMVLVLAVAVVGWHWRLQVEDPRAFRGFLLPVLGSTALLSGAMQCWLWWQRPVRKRWLILASAEETQILRHEVAITPGSNQLSVLFLSPEALANDPSQLGPLSLVDGIAVSDAVALADDLVEQLLSLRSRGTAVCSLVVWAERQFQRVPPELYSSRGLLQAEGFDLHPGRWRWRLKRIGDVGLAVVLLALSLPVIALSALLIRLEDGGPIFYRQLRTGLYGELFPVWKLRSMTKDAEPDGARWARAHDPRITRVGHWLRQWRLDELPQLLAVIAGNMSLIGPRPERPELEAHLTACIPHYRLRHWIRPGLSGWAQVCFPYGASTADSRMKLSYDLYYLRNANVLFDLLILFKTIRLVARGQGSIPARDAAASEADGADPSLPLAPMGKRPD